MYVGVVKEEEGVYEGTNKETCKETTILPFIHHTDSFPRIRTRFVRSLSCTSFTVFFVNFFFALFVKPRVVIRYSRLRGFVLARLALSLLSSLMFVGWLMAWRPPARESCHCVAKATREKLSPWRRNWRKRASKKRVKKNLSHAPIRSRSIRSPGFRWCSSSSLKEAAATAHCYNAFLDIHGDFCLNADAAGVDKKRLGWMNFGVVLCVCAHPTTRRRTTWDVLLIFLPGAFYDD